MMKQAIRSNKRLRCVLRGGSWINNGRNCRSAIRNHNDAGNRNNNIGFRLSLAPNTIGIRVLDQINSLTYCAFGGCTLFTLLGDRNAESSIGKPQGRCMAGSKLNTCERHAAGRVLAYAVHLTANDIV